MAVKITDKVTSDGKAFKAMLKELNKLEVRVGFQAGEAATEEGTDICDIAAFNELGTEHIPSRPFMRDSVDNNVDKINSFLGTVRKQVLRGVPAKDVLSRIGTFQKGLIQSEIANGDFVPNSPETLKRKGEPGQPLIDKRIMRESVNFQITKKGGG